MTKRKRPKEPIEESPLRQLRDELGMSQEEFARHWHICENHQPLGNWG